MIMQLTRGRGAASLMSANYPRYEVFAPTKAPDMAIPKMLQGFSKTLNFYGRFAPSFTRVGYVARLLPLRPVSADFSGQSWLVTGATGGIGRATAYMAAAKGARVYAVGRNAGALASLVAESTGLKGEIVPVMSDLSSIVSIDELSRSTQISGPVDVLVNNVGILNRAYSSTSEGFETAYATSLLGHYHLTEALAAADRLADNGVIINVASGGMFNVPFNLPMIHQGENGFNGFAAYASHKRAQVALADHWRSKFGPRGIHAYAIHPGWADTVGVQTSLPTFRKILKPVLRNASQGADTIIWLAATLPGTNDDRVWFDRKQRTTHPFPHTRQAMTTMSDLVALLDRDRKKALAREPVSAG
jgi:dehydrogenase/reductase SDR family protein 12